MQKVNKHEDKWLKYMDDGRNEPGVKLRITKRYIELLGGFTNAIVAFQNYPKNAQ
jgi:hypothetical protein